MHITAGFTKLILVTLHSSHISVYAYTRYTYISIKKEGYNGFHYSNERGVVTGSSLTSLVSGTSISAWASFAKEVVVSFFVISFARKELIFQDGKQRYKTLGALKILFKSLLWVFWTESNFEEKATTDFLIIFPAHSAL